MTYFNYDVTTASTLLLSNNVVKYDRMHLNIYFNSLLPHTISINTFEDIDFSLLMGQRLILHIILMMKKRTLNLQRLKKGYNSLHLNTLYDLMNRLYIDAQIQPIRELNERQALIEMVGNSPLKTCDSCCGSGV